MLPVGSQCDSYGVATCAVYGNLHDNQRNYRLSEASPVESRHRTYLGKSGEVCGGFFLTSV